METKITEAIKEKLVKAIETRCIDQFIGIYLKIDDTNPLLVFDENDDIDYFKTYDNIKLTFECPYDTVYDDYPHECLYNGVVYNLKNFNTQDFLDEGLSESEVEELFDSGEVYGMVKEIHRRLFCYEMESIGEDESQD